MLVAPRIRSKRVQSAFTLIEVMVGVMLLAILLPSFYLGLSQGFSVVRVTRENLRANQILQEKMEVIRLYTFDQICSNGFVPTSFTAYADPISTQTNGLMIYTGQITITNTSMTESYASDHKKVTVTLTWPSGNIQRQREVTTTVSKYGLHNYYY
ncbi:MAG: hypothetical protein JWN25_2306 [Verrucomicrobiales bacterium]|nr:hypothetical protein [Verrucomicrobiales bacterium]MDB6129271.1 hypothetical protein [Verrucomicrobiales bacterium]